MNNQFDFTGRSAVVTGGASGIGLVVSRLLAEAGAEVHIFDTTPPNVASSHTGFCFHTVDIAESQAVNHEVSTLPTGTNLLVNNAGITRDRTVQKMSDEEWQSVISVNLTGAFNMIRALTPLMRSAGEGRIVNIASINGLRGKFGQANYAAAKAGLIGLTKSVARELGPKLVTVNAVAPGMVLTEMTKELPEEVLARSMEETVLNRLAEADDIALTVLFLLSDSARMITGEVVRVDAGQYI